MISQYKAQAREALHGVMSEPASYTAPGGGTPRPTPEDILAGLSLTIRWHNKIKIIGERSSDDAGVIEGINRLVFNQGQLDALGLGLVRNATITCPGLGKVWRLDYREEGDGPSNVYWSVIEL